MSIAILDYGMANLRSVQKAFEQVGTRADVISTPQQIERADKLVLPGVGAFQDAVATLRDKELAGPIVRHIDSGKSFLGICLGLQMLFDVGYEEYNAQYVITSLRDFQELYVLDDSVHGLAVITSDPYHAELVKAELQKTLGPDFDVSTWMDQNSALLGAVAVEKNVMFIILFCIMIVAALCILSALITFVVQKTREIGMLKALGAMDLQISGLFLSQSGFVGAIGVGAGFVLGRVALAYRNDFLHFLRRTTGLELTPQRFMDSTSCRP